MTIPTQTSTQDPQAIKSRLMEFMDDQGIFRDHRMTGSNLNAVLDVLAYHAYLNAYGTNQVAGESWMDSAQQRDSIVSHAKAMGYVARSKVGSKVDINLTFSQSTQSVNIPRGTRFIGRGPNGTFPFHTTTGQVITAGTDLSGTINAVQGKFVTESFIKTESNDIAISNSGIDLETIRVRVYDNNAWEIWLRNDSIKSLLATRKTYRVFAARNFKYHVEFGDGVLSERIPLGARIEITYLVTDGEDGNGCSTFTAPSINGEVPNANATTPSVGGLGFENNESIKNNARNSRENNDRAVIDEDYADIAIKAFPYIPAITAFGGETVNPPRYGTVFVAVDLGNAILPGSAKDEMVRLLESKSPLVTRVEVIPAKYVDVNLTISPTFDVESLSAPLTEKYGDIRDIVLDYSSRLLGGFNVEYVPSTLCSLIGEVGATSVTAEHTLSIRHDLGTSNTLNFGNQLERTVPLTIDTPVDIHKPTVLSDGFLFNNQLVKLIDDGVGGVHIATANNNRYTLIREMGSVDYDTGDVTLSSMDGNVTNISVRTLTPIIKPARGYVLRLTDDNLNIL